MTWSSAKRRLYLGNFYRRAFKYYRQMPWELNRKELANWYDRQESNLYCELRRLVSYPLEDGRVVLVGDDHRAGAHYKPNLTTFDQYPP